MKYKFKPKQCFLWIFKASHTNMERDAAEETKAARCRTPAVNSSTDSYRNTSRFSADFSEGRTVSFISSERVYMFSTHRAPDHQVLPRAARKDSR